MIRSAIARRLLPRLVAGTLSPSWLSKHVHAWVRADAELSVAYDALRRMENVAGRPALTAGQLDLIEALVLADVDGRGRSRALRWPAFGGAAVAAACVAAFFVIRPAAGPVGSVGDLEARGRALARTPLGLKVSCVDEEHKRVVGEATGGARQSGGRVTCPRGHLLAFSTTNLGEEMRHFLVLGIAADGSRQLFSPFEGQALPVAAGVVDAPVPRVAATGSMPGDEVSLFVLISDEPFSAGIVERQLEDAERKGIPLPRLDRLPVDVPVQARIDVRLAEHDDARLP